MIRVLEVVSALDAGGVERVLYNYFHYLSAEKVAVDFIVHDKTEGMLEKFFVEKFGSSIFRVTPKRKSLLKNAIEIAKIIKAGRYDIVHCHQNGSSAVPLFWAAIFGVGKRVAHAHGASESPSLSSRLLARLTSFFATDYVACSKKTALSLFGCKAVEKGNVKYLYNAFDFKPFGFDIAARGKIRQSLAIPDDVPVLGQVGRIDEWKNQQFTLQVFELILKTVPDAHMMFIGSGDSTSLKTAAEKAGVAQRVHFVGATNEIAKFYSALDAVLMPSLSEGFGIAAVEAQINGLCVYASDVVPDETRISDGIFYLELCKGASFWAAEILKNGICRRNLIFSAAVEKYEMSRCSDGLATLYGVGR